jgi:poly(hydroxyalkanoate) depolymerase family esterase
MDQQRLARMLEATRLTSRARFADAMAVLHEATASFPGGGGGRLPDMRALLSRLPRGMAGMPVSARRPHPAGPGRYLDVSYANAAGQRAAKLYVPAAHAAGAPLIVMLHGGTQNADDFAAGTRMNELAERHGFLVVYPEQSRAANPMGFWNWFQPADQRRGAGEPSILAGLTERTIETYGADGRRVYVAGFSAGGAMAAVMAAAYPEIYAAAAVHSGLPAGAAHDVASAFAAMAEGATTYRSAPVPLIVFHGDADPTVDHVNADCLVRAALSHAAGPPRATTGRVPGGHAYTRRVHSDRDGAPLVEQWTIHHAGHAWSGGSSHGTYTDPQGPDASAELVRFFARHAHRDARRRAA